ncbi:N-acetylglucosamine repressor [Anaerohalosphaera lusitana]|uniref:N-acetylglucosamine repressor n=1 Tax=Anaerohalosphaera lusitana TaxID=1936003 RepID=A0A1U9NM10_9BACT|nr:ROK family transcriptional regulator [Anaerohalosphaera lusitana]AQT68630.1 N-acetylglucosamine repressor [Anaerohalosphaera lusitana]
MNATPIDSRWAGRRNEKLILKILKEQGAMSQTQLCRKLGLGSSTASYIIARLRDKGLLTEKQGVSNRRGPKPTILSINNRGRFILGVEINPSFLLIGAFDFNGDMIEKKKISLGDDHSPERVVSILAENLQNLLQAQSIEEDLILGIGVSLSGSVTSQGRVQMSSTLGWEDVPLKDMISDKLAPPVTVFGTAVRVLAEIGLDPELASASVLYLNVADGVGSTLWMDDRLISGATGKFGELGHIVVDPDGPQCGCGQQGCLEAMISGPAIADRIKKELPDHPQSTLSDRIPPEMKTPELIVEQWASALADGDEYAASIRDFIAETLARIAAVAINLYDPDTIILAGYVASACPDQIADAIKNRMPTDVYDDKVRDISIRTAKSGDESLIRGSAIAILHEALKT